MQLSRACLFPVCCIHLPTVLKHTAVSILIFSRRTYQFRPTILAILPCYFITIEFEHSLLLQMRQDITSFRPTQLSKSRCSTVFCSRLETPDHSYAASRGTDLRDGGIPLINARAIGLSLHRSTRRPSCLWQTGLLFKINLCYLYPAGRIWYHVIWNRAKKNEWMGKGGKE
jgi:hypothetical protein